MKIDKDKEYLVLTSHPNSLPSIDGYTLEQMDELSSNGGSIRFVKQDINGLLYVEKEEVRINHLWDSLS